MMEARLTFSYNLVGTLSTYGVMAKAMYSKYVNSHMTNNTVYQKLCSHEITETISLKAKVKWCTSI
jgi:UDP-3-O-acyl-N-acetylglucosamine deacetylase